MSFTIETLPNEPIVLIKVRGQSNAMKDYPQLLKELGELLAHREGPIYRVSDFSEADNLSFSDLVVALAQEYCGSVPGSAADPRIQVVLVSSNEMLKWGAESAQQEQYGGMESPPIFSTLKEALAYCRAEIRTIASPVI
ncbi:MAG: hypothetical protein HY866_09430 [Chloroflexi bacterium]|nr:hypothetical protein [Chloroflexota bacterium]